MASHRTTHLRAETIERPGVWERARRTMAYFAVGYLMLGILSRWPWAVRLARPGVLFIAWHCARVTRRNLMLNAARLLGEHSTQLQRRVHCKRVLASFYNFIYELGRSQHIALEDLLARVDKIHGRPHYDRARSGGKGAILVTAHLGSYPIAMASLRQIEPHVHVVFRRDPMARFEQLRRSQHERFGVQEAPVGEGLQVWMQLRDALANDEVVLMQGDRVMPDQRGERLAFCEGHMQFPMGPVKLSLATGAPIVPIFAVHQSDGRIHLHLEDPIYPNAQQTDGTHSALAQMAAVIERYVLRYPDQWLCVQPVFCEDIDNREESER